ncbi:MAG: flavodoxin [Candidatus Aenigmatarchaeota archaeon]
MKTLVVFYSRTGTTRKVADEIAKALNCETEEIADTKKRAGILHYLSSGRDAQKEALTTLVEPKKDPSKYDLVVIGTPVWAGKMSVPVRAYLHLKKDNFKKVALFYTAGSQNDKIFPDMSKVCGKPPVATLGLSAADIKKGDSARKIKEFSEKL